jgi:hypothetical protein
MYKRLMGLYARLFVVMALVLAGLTPVSAHPAMTSKTHAMAANAMVMMPGMPMHHEMPAKHMPCCGDDGCCVGGSCAVALPLLSVKMAERVSPASEVRFANALGAGITFPPSLRPPIPRA